MCDSLASRLMSSLVVSSLKWPPADRKTKMYWVLVQTEWLERVSIPGPVSKILSYERLQGRKFWQENAKIRSIYFNPVNGFFVIDSTHKNTESVNLNTLLNITSTTNVRVFTLQVHFKRTYVLIRVNVLLSEHSTYRLRNYFWVRFVKDLMGLYTTSTT